MRIISKVSLSLFIIVTFVTSVNNFAYAQEADTISPSIPGTPSAAVSASGQITVSWSASTDNVGVVGYYLYRNGARIADIPSVPYVDSGLSQAVYAYTVVAYDAAGNISIQSPQVLITAVIDTTPPSKPAGLSAVIAYNPPQITLSWAASTDNMNVVAYYVYRNGMHMKTASAITGTSYTDTDISTGITYAYTVVAYDPAGNSSAQSSPLNVTAAIDSEAPSVPAGASAMATSSSAIALYWASSTDNVGVVGYYVYRNGAKIATVASTSIPYLDSGVASGTYGYAVAAYDLAGNVSNASLPASATLFFDTTSPSVPSMLSATANSTSQINISWYPSNDNVGVIGYYVYRNDTRVATVSKNSYSDTNLAASTTYTYTVVAYDVSGNVSSSSLPITTTTLGVANAQPAQTTAAVTSTASTGTSINSATPALTSSLYRGLRNSQVQLLQNILIKTGYLGATSNTGYFGPLTEKAIQKFQCDNNLACGSANAGWGIVDGTTRDALNNLSGNAGQNTSSTAQLIAQIQALQALLISLLLQVQALGK